MKKVSGSIFVLLGFLEGMTSGIFGYLSREDDGLFCLLLPARWYWDAAHEGGTGGKTCR